MNAVLVNRENGWNQWRMRNNFGLWAEAEEELKMSGQKT